MSTNDWEKSWKNQLDQYDSPVDSRLFDAITSKAAVKSGSTFLFGWIGLGIIIVSSVLIFTGINSKANQINQNIGDRETLLPSALSENISALELLKSASYIPNPANEMNNSGNFVSVSASSKDKVLASFQQSKQDQGQSFETNKSYNSSMNSTISSKTSPNASGTSSLPSSDKNEIISPEENLSIAVNHPSLNTPGKVVDFNDANVRFNAAAPFSVLFPVKRKSKAFLPGMQDPENCFNDARGRSSFYVDAYVGAGNSIRSLSAVENQNDYMHLRDSLEKSWYNSAAGARIGFILASGVAIETGAEYQVHNEIFEYKNESEVRITYKYHYDQFGTVTRIDTITEIGARTLRNHNKYQQITIPLRLGYTMEKGRWMLGARLGVGLHIWNHQRGVILDNTYQTYKIEEDPEGYFNKNWGMQYNASVQIGYRILPQTFLMIEPIWNSQSGGITKRPYTIEQKYQTLRLNVGIRFVPGSY